MIQKFNEFINEQNNSIKNDLSKKTIKYWYNLFLRINADEVKDGKEPTPLSEVDYYAEQIDNMTEDDESDEKEDWLNKIAQAIYDYGLSVGRII
jgi:hypothetical protein